MPQLGTWASGLFGGNSAINSEVSQLKGSTFNPFSGYFTGADGWGNYGE